MVIFAILLSFIAWYSWWATRPRLLIGTDDRLYRIKSCSSDTITIAGKFGIIPTSNDRLFLI